MDAVEAFGKPVFHGRVQATAPEAAKCMAFAALPRPEKFRASLLAQGYEIDGFTSFADHHDFTEAEAAKLLAHDKPLITTEKDMARLQGAPADSARARLAAARQFCRLP